MSLKKTTLMVTLLSIFVFPLNVLAGSGGWDYKGEETYNFVYSHETITDEYVATDGGNFKLDITSYGTTSNTVSATMYVDGYARSTKAVVYSDGTGTIEFSNIPAGSTVFFYVGVSEDDTVTIRFYD